MKKHFKLTNKTINIGGVSVYRIKATRDSFHAKKGELGGFVEKLENLEDDAWVFDDAVVCENSVVKNRAIIKNDAIVAQNAIINGNAIIAGEACISGRAIISGNSLIEDYSLVFNNAMINGNCIIKDNAIISGITLINSTVVIGGFARIKNSNDLCVFDGFGATISAYKSKHDIDIHHNGDLLTLDEFLLKSNESEKSEKIKKQYQLIAELIKLKLC